jgi:hypothetical protein
MHLAERGPDELAACEIICATISLIEAETENAKAGQGRGVVGVYRQHQARWWSSCLLGDACEVCKAHQARKKLNTDCPRAKRAEPAFTVPIKLAVALVRDGLARFVDKNAAIQLTFSKIAHLRDRSLKIDEAFLNAYAAGERWAKNLFDAGYDGKALAEKVLWTPPANAAAISVLGAASTKTPQGLAFHADAFTLGMADLLLPRGVHAADRVSDKQLGVSIRLVEAYDINQDRLPCRTDVLYGFAPVYPELACRLAS